MNAPANQTEELFARIVRSLKSRPGVTVGGKKKKGFGSSALCAHDTIFAMISSKGWFVVKLPKDRVDALVTSGAGVRFDPGHGRVMKEWLVANPSHPEEWLSLAKEALAFVGGKK